MKSLPPSVPIAGDEPIAGRTNTPAALRGAIASLSLAMLLSSLGTSIANVGLPTLAQAFNASFQQVQWVVLAYLLAVTTLIVSAGRLGDLFGRRRLLLAGILLFTLSSVLCALAGSLTQLIAARAAQGMGAALMMALAMALVGESVPKEKTGSAMGLLGSMSAIGTALGPALGGMLIGTWGWPALFMAGVPLGGLALLLAFWFLPADRARTAADRASFDVPGTLLLALTLLAYALSMTIGHGSFGPVNVALLLAAVIGGVVFALVEKRSASPLIRLAMLRDWRLGAGVAMSSLVTTVVMATLVVGPFYLSGGLGLSAAQVGLAMSSGPIVAALTGVPAGRLVDRLGAPAMTLAGLLGMALGAALLPIAAIRLGASGYVSALALLTAGYALFQAANNTAVMSDIRSDQRGVIAGLLSLSRNLGLITGASMMGLVFALGSANKGVAPADAAPLADGMRLTFMLATALIVVAITIALLSQARSRQSRS